MKSLYVTSVVTFAGKTAVCLGLGLHLQAKGFKVGYTKPISTKGSGYGQQTVDEDAKFVKRVLRIDLPPTTLSPVIVNDELMQDHMQGNLRRDLWQEIRDAYTTVTQGKDIVLVEGGASMQDGFAVGLNTVAVIRDLDAKTLVVTRWRDSAYVLDDIMAAQHRIGEHLLGVVINIVPEPAWDFVNETVVPYLESCGIPVYGVLPFQRQLMAVSVGELCDLLDGELLAGNYMRDRLVENFSVGAMTVETALPLLRDLPQKVVITGGDRADMQAAALETSTLCLLLTGGIRPFASIIKRAEERGVAIIVVEHATLETVESIERTLGRTRLGQAEKLNRFQAILAEHFNYERLLTDLNTA